MEFLPFQTKQNSRNRISRSKQKSPSNLIGFLPRHIEPMNKLLKSTAILLSFLVIALMLTTFVVNPDDYKNEVQERFAAVTGHELVISGRLGFDLMPRPFLEITQASLPGALGDQGSDLATIGRLRIYPRLMPLLAGRFELALVRIDDLHLRLVRDAQGRVSWNAGTASPVVTEVIPVSASQVLPEPSPSGPVVSAAMVVAAPPDAGPVVDRVEVLDSQVTWDDRRSGQGVVLDGLEIRAGPIGLDWPMDWQLTGALHTSEGDQPAMLHASGTLRVGGGLWPVRLEPLTVRLTGFGLDPRSDLAADILLRTGVNADPGTERYLADRVSVELALSGGRIRTLADAQVALGLVADLEHRSGTLAAHGRVAGQQLLSAPVLTGDLELDELDLRAWLTQQGLVLPQTADTETFRRLSLDVDWRLQEGRLSVPNLAVSLDETELSGKIEPVASHPQGYHFDLTADRLDLDRYLPPAEPASPRPQASATDSALTSMGRGEARGPIPGTVSTVVDKAASGAIPEPVSGSMEGIAGPDLKGRLHIDELELAQLRFGDTDLEIRLGARVLNVDNRVRRFYAGSLVGTLGWDLRGSVPEVTLVQRAADIQPALLLSDLPWGDRVNGQGEITAALVATGQDADALRRSLTGVLTVQMPQGAIENINLERMLGEARARLQGKALPRDLPRHTEFRNLYASAEIRDGVLESRDLTATADHLRIAGAGTIDLVREWIDYHFEFMFNKLPRSHAIKELEGVPIPVRLTGPLDQPDWDLDLGSLLRVEAERKLGVGEHGEELLRKLEQRTGIKGLKQGLEGLLGP